MTILDVILMLIIPYTLMTIAHYCSMYPDKVWGVLSKIEAEIRAMWWHRSTVRYHHIDKDGWWQYKIVSYDGEVVYTSRGLRGLK